MTGLTQTELVLVLITYFLFLWTIHTFLDEYLNWKPRVFFDANKEDWSEYQYRSSHGLMSKSSPNYEPNVRVEKSASLRVLFIVSESLFVCIFLYSVSFTTDKWRRVLVANTDFDKWRIIDIAAAMYFVQYTYELTALSRYPLSQTTAAHHILTILSCVRVMCGGYFPIGIWYALCGVALQVPENVARVLFIRYAERYPTLTRRALKFGTFWYLLTACICNIGGALVISVFHAIHGHWWHFVVSLLCICVWANDDRHLIQWLWAISQIEYKSNEKRQTKANKPKMEIQLALPSTSAYE